jgi:hypothetical protein
MEKAILVYREKLTKFAEFIKRKSLQAKERARER